MKKCFFLLFVTVILLYACHWFSSEELHWKRMKSYSEDFDHYFEKAQFDSALEIANLQIQTDSTNPLGYYNKGKVLIYYKSDMLDSAKYFFNKALKLMNTDAKHYEYWNKRIEAERFIAVIDDCLVNINTDTENLNTYTWKLFPIEKSDSLAAQPTFEDLEVK